MSSYSPYSSTGKLLEYSTIIIIVRARKLTRTAAAAAVGLPRYQVLEYYTVHVYSVMTLYKLYSTDGKLERRPFNLRPNVTN